MFAARGLMRVLTKPRMARMSAAETKAANLSDPPSGVARAHRCEAAALGGTRVVWLDRGRAANGVVVYVHGGSYVSGPYEGHWTYLSRLVAATAMAGVLVDYRLAPEHPHPAAVDDAFAAIAAGQDSGLLEPGGWALVGDSGGGALAVIAARRLREEGRDLPAALVLCSPSLELTFSNPEVEALEASDPMLTVAGLRRWTRTYIGTHDPRDPTISALFGEPSGLPPTLVLAGSRELMVPDVRAWAQKAASAGVDVTFEEQPGGFHGYAIATPRIPEARRALAAQARFILARTGAA